MTEQTSWLVVTDGRPGHVNQSLGMLQSIDPSLSEVTQLLLPKPRGLLKRPLQLLLVLAPPMQWLLNLIWLAYYDRLPPPKQKVRLIVSTGGDTLIANVILAKLWQTPNVFIGKNSRLTARHTRLVVNIRQQHKAQNMLTLPFAPVRKYLPKDGQPPKPNTAAVLLGGNSNEYLYSENDYRQLAESLNAFCCKSGFKLYITTSRRTGERAETILRTTINPEYLLEATWYSTNPAPTVGTYSHRSSMILCSEDSGTMLTESLHHQKPVIAFAPATTRITLFYRDFLTRLASFNMQFMSLSAIASIKPDTLPSTRQVDDSELKKRLQDLLSQSERNHD